MITPSRFQPPPGIATDTKQEQSVRKPLPSRSTRFNSPDLPGVAKAIDRLSGDQNAAGDAS
jgi:hypothetical protein